MTNYILSPFRAYLILPKRINGLGETNKIKSGTDSGIFQRQQHKTKFLERSVRFLLLQVDLYLKYMFQGFRQ